MKRTEIRVGLIGVGVVGQGILRLLSDNAKQIRERLGVPIVMARMVARDPKKARTDGIARDRLTFNPKDVTQNPNIDIVVEVMGGVDPAYDIVREAIANGKHVVTANKALMAERGNELIELAERKNVDLYFEGAVAGGVPILRLLREAMSSDRITRLRGIVNGTSNYVLTEMGEKGLSFDAAVRGAQEKGYAEADPTLDISGGDAAHKLTILATLAFGAPVRHADVSVEGIENIEAIDMRFADRFGFVIKPLAVARQLDNRTLDLRVHPAFVAKRRPLANIDGALNAVFVEGAMLGPCLISGLGAGSLPTAMSVVSDIVDVGRNMHMAAHGRVPSRAILGENLTDLAVQNIEELQTRYYLRFPVQDESGVLARIATVLGAHDVSLEQLVQDQREEGQPTSIVMLTHQAREGNVRAALRQIEELHVVVGKPRAIRIDE